MKEESVVVQYMPLISTLGGALLGFLTAILGQIIQKKMNSSQSQLLRKNERLEKLYVLLIESDRQVGSITLSTRKRALIGGGDIDVKHQEKAIPSFSELEMLINLYFPKMVDTHNQYSKSRQQLLFHALDVKFIDLNTGQFKNTGEYIAKLDHLDNEYRKCMDGIKAHIMSAIKA